MLSLSPKKLVGRGILPTFLVASLLLAREVTATSLDTTTSFPTVLRNSEAVGHRGETVSPGLSIQSGGWIDGIRNDS